MGDINQLLAQLGAKPSISEENGIALLKDTDLNIFSPGISSGGFAEIRMALANKQKKVIATTIDTAGLDLANENIKKLNLFNQIIIKVEDLTKDYPYPAECFDFIYARLVLHHLSYQELDVVLSNFKKSLKQDGHVFIVVRSEKNVDINDPELEKDPITKLTNIYYRDANKNVVGSAVRYFHTPETIRQHLEKAGFEIDYIKEYQEQLYKDFMRTQIAPRLDHLIEVHAKY